MIRGSTPTHTFTLPFGTESITKAKIMYAQNDKIILIKDISECEITENAFKVTLTQEETYLFNCNYYVQIQLIIGFESGEIAPSEINLVPVGKCLGNEVL